MGKEDFLVSRTQLLVSKIRKVIQEVRDINKYIGKRKIQQSNNLFKQEDLPHRHNPSPHNDEQNGGGCKYSAGNRCAPQFQGEHDKPCNLRCHEWILPLAPPEPVPEIPEQETSHTYPEASSRSTSDSSSLADSCPSGDIADPSSSCNSSSSKLPSEEVTDSREGMDRAEERPDLEGGGGTGMAMDCSSEEESRGEMTMDCSRGEELRGDGAAPIQQVQGWDLKKDR